MSELYWQNLLEAPVEQRRAQQVAHASGQDAAGWSSIGLAGGPDRWQAHRAQYPPLGADPYSAAVLQGFNDSAAGYQYPSQPTQPQYYTHLGHLQGGAVDEDAHALYHNQVDARSMEGKSDAAMQMARAQPTQVVSSSSQAQHSFGIHQPILPQSEGRHCGSSSTDVTSEWLADRSTHNERMCSEPPRLEGHVTGVITARDLASKGSSSCEVIMQGSTETLVSSSVDAPVVQGSADAVMCSGGAPVAANHPNATGAAKSADVTKEIVSPPVSAVEWDQVHAPVAVAQVTPMVTAHLPPVLEAPMTHNESVPRTAPQELLPSTAPSGHQSAHTEVVPAGTMPQLAQTGSVPQVTQDGDAPQVAQAGPAPEAVSSGSMSEVVPIGAVSNTLLTEQGGSVIVSEVTSNGAVSQTVSSGEGAVGSVPGTGEGQGEEEHTTEQPHQSVVSPSTVTATNVARVGPISSQPVDHGSTPHESTAAHHEQRSISNGPVVQAAQAQDVPSTGDAMEVVATASPNEQVMAVERSDKAQLRDGVNVESVSSFDGTSTTPLLTHPTLVQAVVEVTRESAVGSTEPSTDSTAQEDTVMGGARAVKKEGNGKKSVRERYKFIREQYPEVMKRLDRHKTEMSGLLEWKTPPRNVLLMPVGPADANKTPAGSGNALKSSTPKESESLVTLLKHPDVSAIDDRPLSKMSHSFTVPDALDWERNSMRDMDVYGEDFVSSHRRSRYARTRERAPSRGTKSEMGDLDSYGGVPSRPHPKDSFYAYDNHASYSSSYALNSYPSGRHSLGPVHSRYYQEQQYSYPSTDLPLRRRPQSSFDARAYSRYEQMAPYYGAYDVYRDKRRDKEAYTSETDEGSVETDDEMAQIHKQQQMARRSTAMRMGAFAIDPEERYYLGVIQLPQERAQQLLCKYPPPSEYVHLPAIERVAYLFYCALYRRHFHPVDVFHKRFNREFYNYTCDGDSSETALWKICKHTQDEFNSKRSANHLKAYEKSQMQLFSDDRETLDSRVSDRGSHELEEDSDRQSVDSALREPLKFRSPHALLRFGVGGKVLLVDPTHSVSVVEVRDVKTLLNDPLTQRIVEAAESFKGPLIAGVTPTHSVRLYVQRQIERILKSEAYRANPTGGAANDALLVWQLLEMVVQQQGRVTGPDLSRLLMAGHGKRVGGRDKNSPSLSPQPDERNVDPRAYDRFTQFVLGGHVDEAIDCAMREGLYADAMVLARRVCGNDPRKLDRVEAAFLTHRAEHNPVMTLLSVASDMPAPVLTNPPTDDASSWRSHAAVVLANLNSPTAFNTVYHLGRVLARRNLHAAADFCLLAVNLLAGYDPFQPVAPSSEEDVNVRQHISLIHASIPNDEGDTCTVSRGGLSLTDLHATEIFEYATRLANNGMPCALSASLEYQLSRVEYAQVIAGCGGFSTDAFRYCIDVARGVWDRAAQLTNQQLNALCDLADRLQYVATADASETAWIAAMRSIVEQRGNQPQHQYEQAAEQQHTQQVTSGDGAQPADQPSEPVATNKADSKRARNMSLSSEAADWHADHQEPLRMAHVEGSGVEDSAVPPEEQHTPSLAAHSHSDRHQHHILQQRKNQVNSSSASAAQASYAFPPSVPESGKVPSVQQTDSRSLSISESTVEPAPMNGVLYQPQVANERRDSCANEGLTVPSITVPATPQGWQEGVAVCADAREQPSTTSMDSSSTNATASSHLKVADKEPSSETVATNLSSSTVNDSVFTQGESFGTPSEKAPPRPIPRSAVFENTHTSAPITPQPLSAPPTMDQQPEPKPKAEEEHSKQPPVNGGAHAQGGGLFSMLKAKIAKAIPSGNEMILPDDSHPSIVWDPVQNKYVGGGVEESTVSTPPPSSANSAVFDPATQGSSGGLRAARVSGGSRYFNPLSDASTASTQRLSSPAPAMMPIPTTSFGFIPSMPDDDENAQTWSPFSENTAPAEQASATVSASQ